jgi:hypothetical protein
LVAAAGTLVNLAAALASGWRCAAQLASLFAGAFFWSYVSPAILFDGTGYFFFSGVTNFGHWAAVISGLRSQLLWCLFLILAGMASYHMAVLIVRSTLVRYVGVLRNDTGRLETLTYVNYFSAVILSCAGASLLNSRTRRIARTSFAVNSLKSIPILRIHLTLVYSSAAIRR